MSDLDELARAHDVPEDAARHLLEALRRGHGRMAQFDHPALGGLGQWHAGGMTMIGDMFNDGLKARVAALCAALAPLATGPADEGEPKAGWWPDGLGSPSATGSQNEARYAVFPDTRRLVVDDGDGVTVYDTGEHRIGGVSQGQSRDRSLSFSSQTGTVRLHDLAVVEGGEPAQPDAKAGARAAEPLSSERTPSGTGGDHLGTIERLADLHAKGVLSEAEYTAKKAELLARL